MTLLMLSSVTATKPKPKPVPKKPPTNGGAGDDDDSVAATCDDYPRCSCTQSTECTTDYFCAIECFTGNCEASVDVCQPCDPECQYDEDITGNGTCPSVCGGYYTYSEELSLSSASHIKSLKFDASIGLGAAALLIAVLVTVKVAQKRNGPQSEFSPVAEDSQHAVEITTPTHQEVCLEPVQQFPLAKSNIGAL
eukprot:CAMPEP_0185024106 /NCGR_PEP_ID=MMETSP1103-20130426/7023_1 /TAXON_ID=36769 /ORGANISM="Paraphysomonas bandaiensis, Strain Caron Lab Isolate" /LENGTH=193 /DNA_ID=CAMNT_0027556971 /DNA_START=140 /DNA_END=721 /DNA_ORIENTATION=-